MDTVTSYQMDRQFPDKESVNYLPWNCANMTSLPPGRLDLVILFPFAFVFRVSGVVLMVRLNRLGLRHYWPSEVNKLLVTVVFQNL